MRHRLIQRVLMVALAFLMPLAPAIADGIQALGPDEFLRGQFVQERVLQGFAAPLRSEGSFVLAPGQGLIWRAEKPFSVTTVMTQAGLGQQSEGETTLNLPASRAPFLAGLYDMLSGALAGDWRGLERDFVIEKSESEGKWILQLTPRHGAASDAMPIVSIEVSGAAFVEHVEIVKQGGDQDNLSFLAQQRSKRPLDADEVQLLKAVGQP